jgi:type IV pilus assembly protein PilV
VALIEVLVALLVFSIGLLGIVGLQARAIQLSVDSEDRSRAALLANEIVSQMWALRTTSLPAGTVEAWQARVQDPAVSGLPNSDGNVSEPDGDGVVTVTITWRSPARPDADVENRYFTRVVLP